MGSITFRVGDYLNKEKAKPPEEIVISSKPRPTLRKSWRMRKEPFGHLVYAQELTSVPSCSSTRVLWTTTEQPKGSPRPRRHLNNDDLARLREKYGLGNSKR